MRVLLRRLWLDAKGDELPVVLVPTADLDALVVGLADLWAALRQMHHGAMPEAMQKRYEAAYALLSLDERLDAIHRFDKGGE